MKPRTTIKIPVARPDIGPLEKKLINEVIDTGWVSSVGPMIRRFESDFARFIGTKYAVAVSSGTSALDLALNVLGIGPGDEVIVPTFTFAASVNSIIHLGATPVLVDSSPDDWNLDIGQVAGAITSRTKAIIVVHIYGIPANMKKLSLLAKRHGLYIIEDVAEAHGAKYNDRAVGAYGIVGCFSFFANKIITTGEGGMCTTNNKRLQDKMRTIMSHGSKPHGSIYYYHQHIGHNYRMTSMQAALGVAQLSRIGDFLKKRHKHEQLYRRLLSGIPEITFSPRPKYTETVDWMHSILVSHPRISRDKIITRLATEYGVGARPFFYPMHKMPPYRSYVKGTYPVADMLSRHGINLPSSSLLTEKEIRYVANAIRNILGI